MSRFAGRPPTHLRPPPGMSAPAGAPAPTREDASAPADRARKLLSIPSRHEQIARVPFYGGEVGVRVLDDLSVAEAHKQARDAVARFGFDGEPRPDTPAWIEYSVALAAALCCRSVVDADSGFPLWDTMDALRGDLTREDIAYLDERRNEHQRNVAPHMREISQDEINAVLEALAKEHGDGGDGRPKGRSDRPWRLWPRSTLLRLMDTMASRLVGSTGSM